MLGWPIFRGEPLVLGRVYQGGIHPLADESSVCPILYPILGGSVITSVIRTVDTSP